MISYLIDGVLFVAIVAAGTGMVLIYRQLRRLRLYHQQYQRVFAETGYAVGTIDMAIRDINAHGAQILLSLGQRIDEAHKVIGEIDERMEAVADHFEAQQRQAESNVVKFSSVMAGTPAQRNQPTSRPVEKPVQWPTLGERFSQWRSSEERPAPWGATAAKRWR